MLVIIRETGGGGDLFLKKRAPVVFRARPLLRKDNNSYPIRGKSSPRIRQARKGENSALNKGEKKKTESYCGERAKGRAAVGIKKEQSIKGGRPPRRGEESRQRGERNRGVILSTGRRTFVKRKGGEVFPPPMEKRGTVLSVDQKGGKRGCNVLEKKKKKKDGSFHQEKPKAVRGGGDRDPGKKKKRASWAAEKKAAFTVGEKL